MWQISAGKSEKTDNWNKNCCFVQINSVKISWILSFFAHATLFSLSLCTLTPVCIFLNWSFNPLHPNISIHILHTVICIFTDVLTRRICLTIKSFFSWWSFPLFSWHWCVIQLWYCKEKLDAGHCTLRGLRVKN